MTHGANASLANDISVVLSDAFSEAIVVGIRACDDLNDPMSLLQQKQIISSCITVFLHMRDQIECILALDDIARDCVADPEQLRRMFNDIDISMEDGEVELN